MFNEFYSLFIVFCSLFSISSSLYTVPNTPLTNLPELSPPKDFANSIASLIATFGGTSYFLAYNNSKSPILKTFRSMIPICSRGHSGAAFPIILSISSR